MQLVAAWTTPDGDEVVVLRFEHDGWTIEGRLTGPDVTYALRLDAEWRLRQLLLFRDLDDPDLWLATDGVGTWGEVNGAVRGDLAGVVAVAVQGSALLHALAVRAGGGTALVATVDPETLGVVVASRRYEPIGERRWRLEGVEWVVDHHGLPMTHPRFQRVT